MSGGKRLVILGVVSAAIALATTGVSLAIYHWSGDIYLDRSRPGYLPDEEEIEEGTKEEEEFEFSKSGPITGEILDEYMKALEIEVQELEVYTEPFNDAALGDEKLGI